MNKKQWQAGVAGLLLASTISLPALAQQTTPEKPIATVIADVEKEKDIRTLLELTNTGKLMEQMFDQLIGTYQTQMPQVPPEIWKRFRQKFVVSEMLELTIPVYDKHYTKEDIKGMIAFYQTPLGQKILMETPLVTQECMIIGQKWGQAKGEAFAREIRAEEEAKKPEAKKSDKPKSTPPKQKP